MSIQLIVGLGNPGATYEKTRHNAGAWFIEYLANASHGSFKMEKQFHGCVATVRCGETTCQILHPTTFMNHSGRSVQAMAHFYRYQPMEILVVHDELDLPVGTNRLKLGGGHGGHNGLRDIIVCLGSPAFYRLRVGIGHPGHKDLVLDYVLGTPSRSDRDVIDDAIARTVVIMPDIVRGDIQKAMMTLHTP